MSAAPSTRIDVHYPVFVKVTLSVDARLVRRARRSAEAMGISLNEAIRRFLRSMVGGADVEDELVELRELSLRSAGNARGWRFDRDEIHERS
jgi:hypothetical protein